MGRSAGAMCGAIRPTSHPRLRYGPLIAQLRLDLRDRQRDSELRPSGLRFEGDRAVVVAHEAPGDVEPEASALSHWFGGEEWIEDSVANLVRNTGAVIENSHHNTLVLSIRKRNAWSVIFVIAWLALAASARLCSSSVIRSRSARA